MYAMHPVHPIAILATCLLVSSAAAGGGWNADAAFDKADVDADGELQRTEFDSQVPEDVVHLASPVFDVHDADKTKGLSRAEYDRAMDSMGWQEEMLAAPTGNDEGRNTLPAEVGVNLAAMSDEPDAFDADAEFDQADANGDGALQKSEFNALVPEHAQSLAPAFFDSHDVDSSKALSRPEFDRAIDTMAWQQELASPLGIADADKDGMVQPHELNQVLALEALDEGAKPIDSSALFALHDRDGSGGLDLMEYDRAMDTADWWRRRRWGRRGRMGRWGHRGHWGRRRGWR